MRSCGNKRILSTGIALALTVTSMLVTPLRAVAATYTVTTSQEFNSTLLNVQDGDIIILGADLNVSNFDVFNKTITLDTNGRVLDVGGTGTGTNTLRVSQSGELHITGAGEINALGGIDVLSGGKAAITRASGAGVNVQGDGSELLVNLDVISTNGVAVGTNYGGYVEIGHNVKANGGGVNARGGSTAVIHGHIETTSQTGTSVSNGVYAADNSTVTVGSDIFAEGDGVNVTDSVASVAGNVTSISEGGAGVNAHGGRVEVAGNIYAERNGVLANKSTSGTPAVVRVGGNATAAGMQTSVVTINGINASDSTVYVEGDAEGYSNGINASNAVVTVDGDAISSGTYSSGNGVSAQNSDIIVGNDVHSNHTGIAASTDSTVVVKGDVHAGLFGISAFSGSEVTIDGDVYAEGLAVNARTGGVVTVGGDIQSSDRGVLAMDGSVVTVEGTITAPTYIVIGNTTYHAEDRTVPTTKAGYHTYTDGISTVWVRDTQVIPVTGVVINEPGLELMVGQTGHLTAAIEPSNAANQQVKWNSANSDVAQVDSNGKVDAVSEGETTITVTTVDGGYTAECNVTVTDTNTPIASPRSLTVKENESVNLAIHMGQGENRAESAILSGYNSKVIELSTEEVVGEGPHSVRVTGKATGKTTISLGWSGGEMHGHTQEIAVTVTDSGIDPDPEEPKEPDRPGTIKPGQPGGAGNGVGTGSNIRRPGGSRKAGSSGSSARSISDGGTDYTRINAASADSSGVSSAALMAQLTTALAAGEDTAIVKVRNATAISPEILKSLADAAGKAGRSFFMRIQSASTESVYRGACMSIRYKWQGCRKI